MLLKVGSQSTNDTKRFLMSGSLERQNYRGRKKKINNCCQKLGKSTDTKYSLRGLTLKATELLIMIVQMYVYASTHMCQCKKTGDNLYRVASLWYHVDGGFLFVPTLSDPK